MGRRKIGPIRGAVAAVALIVIVVSWWQVSAAQRGVTTRRLEQDSVPLRYMTTPGEEPRPGVVIGHGFSGSQQLMLAYGHVLARAGYHAMLLDFSGHAQNQSLLRGSDDILEQDLYAATAALLAQPGVDPDRIALLGHSMGSGAVMNAGIARPADYNAVVAVSPVPADVTAELPPNLLLQAGQFEPDFVERARTLLAQAGGENEDFTAGLARDFVLIPAVEHITILFSDVSHRSALSWLNDALAWDGATAYRDRRMIWFVIQLVAAMAFLGALSPLLPGTEPAETRRRRPLLGLIVAPFIAAGVMGALGQVVELGSLGGLEIGGAFGLWIFLVGALWLAAGYRPGRPAGRDLLWGVLLFAFLWAAFGLLAQVVWLPWFLNGPRLLRWPFLAIGCVLWQLAAAGAQHGAGRGRRFLWWLGQSVFLVGGLIVTLFLVPRLGFLFLLVPVIPLVLAVMTVANGALDRPWAAGLANGLFFAWLPLALFPLV